MKDWLFIRGMLQKALKVEEVEGEEEWEEEEEEEEMHLYTEVQPLHCEMSRSAVSDRR